MAIAMLSKSANRSWVKSFANSPDCLNQLSDLLARRKLETEGIIKDATQAQSTSAKEREYSASFLRRLRTFFEL